MALALSSPRLIHSRNPATKCFQKRHPWLYKPAICASPPNASQNGRGNSVCSLFVCCRTLLAVALFAHARHRGRPSPSSCPNAMKRKGAPALTFARHCPVFLSAHYQGSWTFLHGPLRPPHWFTECLRSLQRHCQKGRSPPSAMGLIKESRILAGFGQ